MTRVLSILLLLAGHAFGEVHLAGNKLFGSVELRKGLRSAGSQEEFRRQVLDWYLTAGYFAASVKIEADGDTTITIDEGRGFRATDLRFAGIDTSIASPRELAKDNSPLEQEYLEEITKRVVESYAESGYPFCQAGIEKINIIGDKLNIEYAVVTGPRATFGTTEFTGLVTTKKSRLRGRLRITEGQEYRESVLQRSARALSQLNYTRPTSGPVVAHDTRTNSADVIFAMRDERNLTVDGIFYLNSDNSIGGSGDLGLLNIFGTGEHVGLHWSRLNKDSRDLGLGMELPYAGGYPVDVRLDAVQSDRDSAFVSAKLQVGAMYHFSELWQLGSTFSWEKITPDVGRLSPSARIAGVTLKTSFQKRDRLKATREGLAVVTEFGSLYRRSFSSGSDVSTGYSTIIKAKLELWQPMAKRWIVYQRIMPFQVRSDFEPVPLEQLVEIGGPASVRGYRERSYLADIGVVSATELRYLLEGNFVTSVFCDLAAIETEAGTRKLTGFGLGMELETTAGRFRLDFSLGEEKQLDAMLVHFGFETGL